MKLKYLTLILWSVQVLHKGFLKVHCIGLKSSEI